MAKQKIINPIQGFKPILNEILNSQDILYNDEELKKFFPNEDNRACLNMIIPVEFINKGKNNIYQRLFGADRSLLSNLMTGTNANGILSTREELARYISNAYEDYTEVVPRDCFDRIFCVENICDNFTLRKMPLVHKALTKVEELSKNSKKNTTHYDNAIALDYVRKYILFLYGKKRYPEFFHMLFLFSILQ